MTKTIEVPGVGTLPVIERKGDTDLFGFDSEKPDEGTAFSTGYIPRDLKEHPYGSIEYATPFDLPSPSRSDWPELVRAYNAGGASPAHHFINSGKECSNQNGLPYCWIHGSVQNLMVVRMMQGLPYVYLEPTSAGAIIKRFAQRGGNTPEAIKHLAEHGVCEGSLWPPNKLDRDLVTDEMKENSKKYRITEWFELRNNSFEQTVASLLYGYPVTVGFSWWGHMVLAVGLAVLDDGSIGIIMLNSWGPKWGFRGLAVLNEKMGTSFDQFALRVGTYSVVA